MVKCTIVFDQEDIGLICLICSSWYELECHIGGVIGIAQLERCEDRFSIALAEECVLYVSACRNFFLGMFDHVCG